MEQDDEVAYECLCCCGNHDRRSRWPLDLGQRFGGLITWVAFVSWALFFAAGGGFAAVRKVVPTVVTGVIYGTLLLAIVGMAGGSVVLPVGIAVIAFLMCVQANWSVLAFIPGAFAGCAALFGGAGDWLGVSIALICGALLGWFSEAAATALNRPRADQESSSHASASA